MDRTAFADLAATVRPGPDPSGRPMRRHRRRLRVRLGLVAAGVAVAVGAAGTLALAPAGPHPDPAPGRSQQVFPPFMLNTAVTSAPVRALLDAPTRGNLAGDAQLAAQVLAGFRGRQQIWGVPAGYTDLKLLLLAGDAEQQTFVAAYSDPAGAHAVIVSASAAPGVPVNRVTATNGDGCHRRP